MENDIQRSSAYWLRRAKADEARSQELAGKTSEEMRRLYLRQYQRIVRQLMALRNEAAESPSP